MARIDVVMGVENAMGLGFLLPTEWCPLGGPGSFGTAGFGGSRAWANPELGLAFAYHAEPLLAWPFRCERASAKPCSRSLRNLWFSQTSISLINWELRAP
jgi:hypothetical protein